MQILRKVHLLAAVLVFHLFLSLMQLSQWFCLVVFPLTALAWENVSYLNLFIQQKLAAHLLRARPSAFKEQFA